VNGAHALRPRSTSCLRRERALPQASCSSDARRAARTAGCAPAGSNVQCDYATRRGGRRAPLGEPDGRWRQNDASTRCLAQAPDTKHERASLDEAGEELVSQRAGEVITATDGRAIKETPCGQEKWAYPSA